MVWSMFDERWCNKLDLIVWCVRARVHASRPCGVRRRQGGIAGSPWGWRRAPWWCQTTCAPRAEPGPGPSHLAAEWTSWYDVPWRGSPVHGTPGLGCTPGVAWTCRSSWEFQTWAIRHYKNISSLPQFLFLSFLCVIILHPQTKINIVTRKLALDSIRLVPAHLKNLAFHGTHTHRSISIFA